MPSFRVSMRIFKQTAALQSSKWLFAAITGTFFLASVNVAAAQTTTGFQQLKLTVNTPATNSSSAITLDSAGKAHVDQAFGTTTLPPIDGLTTASEFAQVNATFATANVTSLPTSIPDTRGLVGVPIIQLDSTVPGGTTYTLTASLDWYLGFTTEVKPLVDSLNAVMSRLLFAQSTGTGAWISLPSIPTVRIGPAVAAVKGIIYTIGGQDPISGQPVTAVEPFDTRTKTWGTAAQLPIPISHAVAAATPDGKIHVAGGCLDANCFSPTNIHLKYDPATNSWSFGTPMPTPRWGHGLVTGPSGMLYVFGGAQGTTLNPQTLGCPDTSVLEIFNPSSNTWTTGPAMPMGRFGEAAYPDQRGQIIAAGGKTCDLPNLVTTPLSDVIAYDLTTNAWVQSKLPSLPFPTSRATGFSLNEILYLIDGNTGGACNGCVFKLDAIANPSAWVEDTSDPISRYAARGVLVNGIFYVLGGIDAVTGVAVNTNEAFTTGRPQAPAISKIFSPTIIQPIGGSWITTSTLTLTVINDNSIPTYGSFRDTLPANVGSVPGSLVVANPPNVLNNCGGTVTAVAGSGSISFSNPSLPPGTCTIQVNVQSAVDNLYLNDVAMDLAGDGGWIALSSLTVVSPPQIVKTFAAATIQLNQITTVNFKITNPNQNRTLDEITFADSLPAGLRIAPTDNGKTDCHGLLIIGPPSTLRIQFGTLGPGASCMVSVDVQATQTGTFNNSVTVADTLAGTGNTSTAALAVTATKVVKPPVITKVFSPATILVNGHSTLSFTITNPNTDRSLPITGITFTDILPPGLLVAPLGILNNSCGGTVTADRGSSSITLSGVTLEPGASCTLSVDVRATTAGLKTNSVQVTATESGSLSDNATGTINVIVPAPPAITKKFGAASIPLNGTTTLTFVITNPNSSTTLTGITFVDLLPPGLQVDLLSQVIGGCPDGIIGVGIRGTNVVLAGASLPPNSSCTFTVNVIGTAAGVKNNLTNAVTSNEAGPGNIAKSTLTVVAPPTIAKSFGAAKIPLEGATSIKFVITNPNASTVLTGISFADNLPLGMVVATPNGLTGACPAGAINTFVGSVALLGATLAPNTSCTFSLNVTGITPGTKNNTTTAVTSNEGGTGNTATASLTVIAPPLIAKKFGADNIPLAGSTSLTFTITNPNDRTLTGVGFVDPLPTGLVVATPNGQSGTCVGGTINAIAGSNTISLSNATLLPGPSCTFSVNVTGIAVGTQNNVTGKVSSPDGGTGGTASASINVLYRTDLGHSVLSPISVDGSSVFNAGRTVPVKFQVFDANGNSIGTPGVVVSFFLTEIITGTSTTALQDVVDTNNPDTAFRFDPSAQQWIFNISTKNLTAGSTYVFTIMLNDGTTIVFQFGQNSAALK